MWQPLSWESRLRPEVMGSKPSQGAIATGYPSWGSTPSHRPGAPEQLHAGAECSEEIWAFGLLLPVLVKYGPHQERTLHLGMPLNAPYLKLCRQLPLGRVQISQAAGSTKYRLQVFWRNAMSCRMKQAWHLAL